MIQDITRIQEELEGFQEVEMPFTFPKEIHIKYLTVTDKDGESFYPGGTFQGIGNHCLYLKDGYKRWSVPTKLFHKDGLVRYTTRFFVPKDSSNIQECRQDVRELQETVMYQQELVDKLVNRLKTVEEERSDASGKLMTYESLIRESQDKMREMSHAIKDQDKQLHTYKKIIKQLSQSHPLV